MTPPRRLLLITGLCGVVALTGLLPQTAFAGLRKLYVSPRGSDAGRCTKARPCRSFDRAYRVARPGQIVIVRGGVYRDQTIRRDRRKKSNRNVVFRSAKRAKVVIATDLDVHGSHMTFSRMRLVENWYAHPGARDLVFSRIRAQRFYIASARNIRVLRSNFGPSINAVAQIKSATGSSIAPRGIVLNRVYMHDFQRTSSDQHMECLHVMAVDGLAIRRSKFRDCSIFDISFNLHGDSNKMRRILIENSYFDKTLDDGHYAVHFSEGGRCEALIRYNTFLQGISSQCAEGGAGVRIHSNILPKSPTSCRQNGYSWNWNVYERGRRCGPDDRVARVRFVNRLRFDLRLARRSAAIGRGNPKSFPRADILGKRRPFGRKPDAGAHERR